MQIKQCNRCGKDFKTYPSTADALYCSSACYHYSERITIACERCGKIVRIFQGEIGRARFCSAGCRNAAIAKSNERTYNYTCDVCHKPFSKHGRIRHDHKTCSPACAEIGRKIEVICKTCGASFRIFPSRSHIRYCSKQCASAARQGEIRTSEITECVECGKSIKRFKSRAAAYQRGFCSNECYHAWDSKYKSTPAMRVKLTKRLLTMGQKPSGIEDRVAEWLDSQGIAYERQVIVKHYKIDFQVGDAFVEVNGCYWHACAEHFPMINATQQKRIYRDKRLASYCRNHNIPLIIIWEHDIRKGDYTAISSLITS